MMLLFGIKLSAQQVTSADLQVTGLTCSMCSNATQKSLETIGFIQSVKPDLNKNLFVLTFKKDANINLDLLKKKVEDAGFSVGGLSANFNFNQLKVDESGTAEVNGVIYRFVNVKNKTLNGIVKAAVVDKNFVSNAAFKKQATLLKSTDYNAGSGLIKGKKMRIFHLLLS